jgi:hypothetical protein
MTALVSLINLLLSFFFNDKSNLDTLSFFRATEKTPHTHKERRARKTALTIHQEFFGIPRGRRVLPYTSLSTCAIPV